MRFFKYHGLGNDFAILDRLEGGEGLSAEEAILMCDRHRGVGADGVLTVWNDTDGVMRMHIQNADGTEAAMCGNGLRCVVRYLYDSEHVPADVSPVNVRVGQAVYQCKRTGVDHVQVEMGCALDQDTCLPPAERGVDEIELNGQWGTRLSMGNPHWVAFTDDDPTNMAQRHGKELEEHHKFPDRVNVSFARKRADGFDVVVWERGVGITQACGSGACAVAAAAVRRGKWPADTAAQIHLLGGPLKIAVAADGAITMTGEARRVFVGDWS